jgi:tetratricopeptide (TPR) repeat protein
LVNWLKQLIKRKERRRAQILPAPDYEKQYSNYRAAGFQALAQGRLNEAIDALGRAVLFRSNDPVAHLDLGRALQLDGKTEAARHAYLRALSLNPKSPELRQALIALPPLPPGRSDFQINQVLHLPDLFLGFLVLEIKKGSFGAVYVVENLLSLSPERSALKTFQARYLWSDEDRKRFEREALHWIMLDRHPNIVGAQTLLVIEGFPCLWLEYLPYSLAELLQVGPLSPKTALELSIQFCDGMFHANQKMNLVHRDVKPSNCLLTEDARVLKVSDWGLSRTFADIGKRSLDLAGLSPEISSQFTSMAGTPQYMAPEQFSVGVALDTRTDIYSFGVMLYEMLTKNLPPIGYLAYSHIAGSATARGISDSLKQLILHCVQPNPGERPSDFRELRIALASAYHELTGAVAPPEAEPLEMTGEDWSDKGHALSQLGYHDEACACYERAVDLSPNNAGVWGSYSGELIGLGRVDRAWECIKRGLQIDPDEPGLWKNKGIFLKLIGCPEEARACFARGLDLQSKSNRPAAFWWADRAAILADAGNLESALQCCDAGLASNKLDASLWSHKAIIACKLGRYEDADLSCKQGLEIEPRNQCLWNTQTYALLNLGRSEEALIACNRGLEIDPDDAHLWVNKGSILRALGKPDEAQKCLERARALKN